MPCLLMIPAAALWMLESFARHSGALPSLCAALGPGGQGLLHEAAAACLVALALLLSRL